MKNFLYIGKFIHFKGKDLGLLEKKIGITGNLEQREFQLNRTNSPIGYVMIAAWDIGEDAHKTEQMIQALFDDVRSEGEWFEDDNDNLIARVSKFMRINEYREVDLSKEKDSDANAARKIEQEKIKMSELRAEHMDCLRGIPFHTRKYGEFITVTMQDDGKFFCTQTGEHYDSLNSAFTNAGKKLTGRDTFPINAWITPYNENNQSPDDIIKAAAKADSSQ